MIELTEKDKKYLASKSGLLMHNEIGTFLDECFYELKDATELGRTYRPSVNRFAMFFLECGVDVFRDFNSVIIHPYTFCNIPMLKEVVIPEGVECIQMFAFKGCRNLTKVVFPSSLYQLGSSSFYDCNRLEVVEFSDTIEIIQPRAFTRTSILNLSLPDSITFIGENAFRATSIMSLKLPAKLQSLEEYVFAYCTNLTDVEIPDSVEKIEAGAFAGCTSLRRVRLPANLKKLDVHAFQSCKLTEVYIPSTIDRDIWEGEFHPDSVFLI